MATSARLAAPSDSARLSASGETFTIGHFDPAKGDVQATEPASEVDANFTLDAALLAQRRAASARRVHTVQIPAVRAAGFAILCVIAVLQDVRLGIAADRAAAAGALLAAQPRLRGAELARRCARWYGRTGRARSRPGLPAPRHPGLAAQPAPSRAGAPVLRLPAADPRRRPGRLRLSPGDLLQPRRRRSPTSPTRAWVWLLRARPTRTGPTG